MRKLPVALAFLALPLAAHADSYNFSISTDPSTFGSPATSFVASGTLTGTPEAWMPNLLNLTSITGSAQGYAFTGVAPIGADTSLMYDNVLYTGAGAHVDDLGVLLYLNSPIGTSLAHVYDTATGYHVDVFDPHDPGDITPFTIASFTLEPSAVPEPSSLALLGTGALGIFAALRRRLGR